MKLSELFHSIQGEGTLQGMPSTFIRTAFCNLTCSWCDAAYTWKGKVEFTELDVDAIANQVRHRCVVVTGGEPTIEPDFPALVRELAARGRHVTVETNGVTLVPDTFPHVQLWSVSPKLGTSGQADALNLDTIRDYVHRVHGFKGHVQLKFVVGDEGDFQAALALLRDMDCPFHVPVFMQPNGLCHIAALEHRAQEHTKWRTLATDTNPGGELSVSRGTDSWKPTFVKLSTPYLDRVRWLYERVVAAEQAGELPVPVRATVQAHKLAWGNRRGF